MSETTVDPSQSRRMTVTVNMPHGSPYYMTIFGATDADVQRQFELFTDHDMVHLLVDNMVEQYARMQGFKDLNDPSVKETIDRVMDEAPAADSTMSEHTVNLSDRGHVVASAVITAPDQLKAARVLFILGHSQQQAAPSPAQDGAVGTFGQPLAPAIPSIEEQLNDPDFFEKLKTKGTDDGGSDPASPTNFSF
jgi:hypothetical protein